MGHVVTARCADFTAFWALVRKDGSAVATVALTSTTVPHGHFPTSLPVAGLITSKDTDAVTALAPIAK